MRPKNFLIKQRAATLKSVLQIHTAYGQFLLDLFVTIYQLIERRSAGRASNLMLVGCYFC